MLSIIIPSEMEDESLLSESIRSIGSLPQEKYEIIFIGKRVASTRAQRLNLGFHQSKGEIILFHHPRSRLDVEGVRYLIALSENTIRPVSWGGFTHRFDLDHPLLRFTSWYSNRIRASKRGILYLDHCIFFDRKLWLVDIPHIEIFEDTELSRSFRKISKPVLLPFESLTSAIRFKKNGVYYQSLLNQILKLGFYFRWSPKLMNRVYEKGLNLNH